MHRLRHMLECLPRRSPAAEVNVLGLVFLITAPVIRDGCALGCSMLKRQEDVCLCLTAVGTTWTAVGSVMVNVLPSPTVLVADIVPLCASVSDLAIANPRPVSPFVCSRAASPR